MAPVKVLLADDHTLVRQGMASLLEHTAAVAVVGQAASGPEAVVLARQLRPDVVLMDVNMPGGDGVEATRLIRRDLPHVNVVMVTVSERDEDVFRAVKAGAKGYVLKSAGVEDLLRAITCAAVGEAVLSPSMAAKLLIEFSIEPGGPIRDTTKEGERLTRREEDVLELLASGARNREIASTLFISESTVKTHLRSILDKLHLRNRSQAAAWAARERLGSSNR